MTFFSLTCIVLTWNYQGTINWMRRYGLLAHAMQWKCTKVTTPILRMVTKKISCLQEFLFNRSRFFLPFVETFAYITFSMYISLVGRHSVTCYHGEETEVGTSYSYRLEELHEGYLCRRDHQGPLNPNLGQKYGPYEIN